VSDNCQVKSKNTNPTSSPLIYRLAARVDPLPKRGIEVAYKAIRNRLRRYSGSSIVDLALRLLWNPPAEKIEEIRSAPWLTLLLVKWALQDNGVNLRVGPPISQAEFDRLRQELWALQEPAHGEKPNVWLMLRYLMYVQVEFQRLETWGFLRWPALYARLAPGCTNRKQFRKVLGMEPEVFFVLAYALYAPVLSREMPIAQDYLAAFRQLFGDDVDRMFNLLARDLPSLRAELQADDAQRVRGKQELFEFPYLRRFPYVRLRDGRLHCWHPIVFARGIEDAVHLRLSSLGAEYVNEFSRVYEQYVTELAMGCGLPALDEATYKAQVGGHSPSVEVILEGEDCNIFVEAKMSLFADDVMLQENSTAIYHKTKRVREAIKQGWRVGAHVRDPICGFGERFQSGEDFLLVVTSRELFIGGGAALQRLYGPGLFDYPDPEAGLRLPWSHVFILSIEDFERTMGCVAAGEINLSAVLREAVLANQRGDTARMFLSDFIGKYTKRWTLPGLITDARRTAESHILLALGEPPDAFEDTPTVK
jgi:hypothetical protein